MAQPVEPQQRVDLRSLELRPGEATQVTVVVPDDAVVIGGTDYRLQATDGTATLDVSNAHTGWHLRLRVSGRVSGPCWRCLEPAEIALRADMSDFGRFDPPTDGSFDEDLDCEYIAADALDAVGMARDGLLEGIPATILCRADCAGLCPNCGANLNHASCTCGPAETDSRWDALKQIAARLEETE